MKTSLAVWGRRGVFVGEAAGLWLPLCGEDYSDQTGGRTRRKNKMTSVSGLQDRELAQKTNAASCRVMKKVESEMSRWTNETQQKAIPVYYEDVRLR